MSRAKPSFWLFLINKMLYIKNLPFSLVFLIITISIIPSYSPRVRSYIPLIIVAVILVIGIRLLFEWKKFQELTSIFKSGSETFGNVIDVYFSRGSGYITYEYEYQQKQYRSTDTINQNRKTKEITIDQKVALYVNQEKPVQAFIRDLYLNTF